MNRKHERMIRAAEAERKPDEPNAVRYYYIVDAKRNREAVVTMYAAHYRYADKAHKRKTGELEIQEAVRYETDKPEFRLTDFDAQYLSGYKVYFESDGWHCGSANYPYKFGGNFLVRYVRYLNGFEGTKYEHGYDVRGGLHIMEYAELHRISPRVEFLVRGGFERLLSPAFVRRLSNDSKYFRWFRDNAAEIQRRKAGMQVISHAYAHGQTIGEAERWQDEHRLLL